MSQLAGGIALLMVALLPRNWLEAVMWRHMLLQLPLLVVSGWLFGCGLVVMAPRWMRRVAIIDLHGITGMTAALFISAYWMIPRALELSINLPLAAGSKFGSLLLLGALLPGTLKRANIMIQLFFLGNFCWMTAIAGLQYQTMPQRLCNAYLLDDQFTTGVGLVLAAVAVAVFWCARHAPELLSNSDKPRTSPRLPLW
jgi:hypothetical protein